VSHLVNLEILVFVVIRIPALLTAVSTPDENCSVGLRTVSCTHLRSFKHVFPVLDRAPAVKR
jgi:hypothetical protein